MDNNENTTPTEEVKKEGEMPASTEDAPASNDAPTENPAM